MSKLLELIESKHPELIDTKNYWIVKRGEKNLRGTQKRLSQSFEDIKNLVLGGEMMK